MKKTITTIITLIILFGATYGVASATNSRMIDWAFFIGLLLSVVIYVLTSSGGTLSRHVHLTIQSQTGIRQEVEKQRFNKSFPFYTSLIYTIVSLLITIIVYWDRLSS